MSEPIRPSPEQIAQQLLWNEPPPWESGGDATFQQQIADALRAYADQQVAQALTRVLQEQRYVVVSDSPSYYAEPEGPWVHWIDLARVCPADPPAPPAAHGGGMTHGTRRCYQPCGILTVKDLTHDR